MTDRRLSSAQAAIAAGRVQVLSVDVFDTLLWRRVPEPADVFLLLGRSLKDGGRLAKHITPIAFAELRRAAERAARADTEARTGSREITLTDIYKALPGFVFAPDFDPIAAAEAEFACERTLMIRDLAVGALMQMAKAAGVRVILVSDTYFSSAQVKTFLAKPGLIEGRDFDRLYVSCEAGRPKWRDLFDTVLADMGVAPDRMLHVGDTLEADVWPCRARGIGFVHFSKWDFAPRVQSEEWPAELRARAGRLGPRGDHGLTGLRSRLFHHVPVDMDAALVPFWRYGAAHLAPVFAAFARWIVASCRDDGVRKIYGIMREGRFLNRLVGETAAALGVDVAGTELWLSRRAVIRAALRPETLALLPEFVLLTPGRTTDEVLAGLGLTTADLAEAGLPRFDYTADTALADLCRAIATTPRLTAKVMAVAAGLRANLLTALGREIDLGAAGPVSVMDLGYSATIQSVLQDLLALEGLPVRLTGRYLAVNARALDHLRTGADIRGYLDADGFGGPMGRLLSRVPFVLEHACMCAEGTLSHFDEAGAPVLLPSQRLEGQLRQMEAMQAGILYGVEQINRLFRAGSGVSADDESVKAQVESILTATHLHPSSDEAATVGAWSHEAKADYTPGRRLADLAFDPVRLEYAGWPGLQDIGLDQVYWPAAAFASADPFIAAAYAAGFEGRYKPEHLTSGPVLGSVIVCPDLGAGFDERRQGGIPLAVNVFGRATLKAEIKPLGAESYVQLRLRFPAGRAIIALDGATVTYTGEAQRLARVLPAPSRWDRAEPISGGLLTDGHAETIIVLPDPPPWLHGIELSLRLKYLRLDPLFGGAR